VGHERPDTLGNDHPKLTTETQTHRNCLTS